MKSVYKKFISLSLAIGMIAAVFAIPSSSAQIPCALQSDTKGAADRETAYVDPALSETAEKAGKDEKIPVMVWLAETLDHDGIETAAKEKSERIVSEKNAKPEAQRSDFENLDDTQIYIETRREIYAKEFEISNLSTYQMLFADRKAHERPALEWSSRYSPVIKLSLSKAEIEELSSHRLVKKLYLDDFQEYAPDIDAIAPMGSTVTSPASVWQGATNAAYVRDTLGLTGSGVKVGVYDIGVIRMSDPAMDPYRAPFVQLNSAGRLIVYPNANTGDPRHAAYCASIIAASGVSVNGIAPGVTIYSTSNNKNNGRVEDGFEWLIAQGVNIISCSVSWSPYNNEYGYFSEWFDYLIANHGVLFCKSIGNEKSGTGRNVANSNYSYNAIVVGSSNDNNTASRTDDTRAGHSLFNFYSILPVKPDLLAPGEGIMTPLGPDGGTSLATPQVAAIAAQLYQAKPALKSNPLLAKAILMAGLTRCGEIFRYSVAGDGAIAMGAEFGAGEIDSRAARGVAVDNRYVSTSITIPASTTYTRNINVTSGDNIIRVCLTWNSVQTGTNIPAKIYLRVTAPNGTVYKSETGKGTVQLVSFVPPVTGTYTIQVTVISGVLRGIGVNLAWY